MTFTPPAAGEDVSLTEMYDDPYPTYDRLRAEAPVAWVPQTNRYLVTRYDDINWLEKRPEIFSAAEDGSLITRIMGHTLMRKDGDAHKRERSSVEPSLRPRMVTQHWAKTFEKNTNDLIDDLCERGSGDLFSEFAGPLAARNLAALLGLPDVDAADMQRWSQSFMDGGGNYADDPAVWDRAMTSTREVDEAVREAMDHLRDNPDESVISSMMHAPEPLDYDQIRANVKVFIGGGLNEPRDSISVATWAVLTHPEVRAEVDANPTRWRDVFEEAIRWIAPIGMYPRQVAQRVELGGTVLEPGARLGICVGAANRDPDVFERPDDFDINRPKVPHVAFGGGPHFCAGTWVARTAVAQVALPTLFRRLPGLAVDPSREVKLGGWVFRGLLTLPAVWDADLAGALRQAAS